MNTILKLVINVGWDLKWVPLWQTATGSESKGLKAVLWHRHDENVNILFAFSSFRAHHLTVPNALTCTIKGSVASSFPQLYYGKLCTRYSLGTLGHLVLRRMSVLLDAFITALTTSFNETTLPLN